MQSMFRRGIWSWSMLAALGCGPSATAEPAAVAEAPLPASAVDDLGQTWVRIARDDGRQPLAMQTAIVRYVPADEFVEGQPGDDYPQYVDLVAAVHVGDPAYYAELNRRFRDYDAVLYELVAPEGTVVPRGRGTSNAHALGAVQNAMKSMLELSHQLEEVDYTRRNFVHADMSPEDFVQSMTDRKESFLELYFRILGASMAHQSQTAASGESPEAELMVALLANDRARRLKVLLAKQFEGMESLMLAFNGTDGTTIITERNNRALDVLRRELDNGRRRTAVFYGAGHLGDMHQKLLDDFDLVPASITWLDAWDLRAQ